jgi:hypothetical protein
MEIAGHPGIDDVVDVIVLGRAHEIRRSIEVREGWQSGGGVYSGVNRSHKDQMPAFQVLSLPIHDDSRQVNGC